LTGRRGKSQCGSITKKSAGAQRSAGLTGYFDFNQSERYKMKKILLKIELTYNEKTMHEDDQEGLEWFINGILKSEDGLILHSNYIGDELGEVKVVDVLVK